MPPASAGRSVASQGGWHSSRGASAAPARGSWLPPFKVGMVNGMRICPNCTEKAANLEAKSPERHPEPRFRNWLRETLFGLADRDLQRADAVDPAFDSVAGRQRRDPRRRSRHDDVAGAERDLLGQVGDDLRHAP